jgi:hypothetical protein
VCGSHEDYEVFQKTFVFWFNISEEIYTNPRSERLCELFRDHIYTLIECICKHCQLDPTSVRCFERASERASYDIAFECFILKIHFSHTAQQQTSIPPYKSDDFGEFRLKATDLVSDIVFIVEANKCFEKVKKEREIFLLKTNLESKNITSLSH